MGGRTDAGWTPQTALHRACLQHLVGLHRIGEALQSDASEFTDLEQLAQQTSRIRLDDNSIRFGEFLQTCCKVRRLTHNSTLLSLTGSYEIANDNQSSANPDSDL